MSVCQGIACTSVLDTSTDGTLRIAITAPMSELVEAFTNGRCNARLRSSYRALLRAQVMRTLDLEAHAPCHQTGPSYA